MIKLRPNLLIILALAVTLLGSCVGGEEGKKKTVKVLNSGIVEPVTFEINESSIGSEELVDLGEYVKADDPVTTVLKITNNSSHKINGLGLQFVNPSVTQYKFKVDSSGAPPAFPGDGGTCGSVILAGQSCELHLQFSSATSGFFLQEFIFEYRTNTL